MKRKINKKYRVNKGIPTSSMKALCIIVLAMAGKLSEFAALAIGIPVSGAEFVIMVDNLLKSLALGYANKGSGSTDAQIITQLIRDKYSLNATFIEELINLTNNPSLAAKLGYVLSKLKGKVKKVPIKVTNTIVQGVVLVVLAKIWKAHSYIVEYTQIEEDGTPIETLQTTLGLTRGTISGLKPGAKYLFRSHPVNSGNLNEIWSAYVLLRIS